MANVGQTLGRLTGREASRRDDSARRERWTLILLTPFLFPFKQQLMPCAEIRAGTGAERGAAAQRGDEEGEDGADARTQTPRTDAGASGIGQNEPGGRSCSLENRKMQPPSRWRAVS